MRDHLADQTGDDELVAQFRAEGYVAPAFRFDDATLAAMRAAAARLVAARPDYADFCPELLVQDPLWLNIASTPGLLDQVSRLIGDDIILWGSGYFGKPARIGKETPWHQDGEYWPIRPLATVTAWVALDDTSPANGCLRLIPGSHAGRRLLPHGRDDSGRLTLNQVLDQRHFDPGRAVDIILEAGEVSLHDVYMIHGSAANRSPRRRAAVTFRYMPATSHFDRALAAEQHRRHGIPDVSQRPLYLVRGSDRSGRNFAEAVPSTKA